MLDERVTEGTEGVPTGTAWAQWSDDDKVKVKACYDEAILEFVTYAKGHLDAISANIATLLPAITSELAPLGITIAPEQSSNGVYVYHKTHAAPRGGKPGLHLVPLSGGVFQIMLELAKGEHKFYWNIVDFEADWKSVQDRGDFTSFAESGGNTPVHIVSADADPQLHGIRIPTKEWMRKDLNLVCQPGKEGRRGLKRDYWDWANDPNKVPLD
jgi:hypothetical protein